MPPILAQSTDTGSGPECNHMATLPALVIAGWEPKRTEHPLKGFFATWNLSL